MSVERNAFVIASLLPSNVKFCFAFIAFVRFKAQADGGWSE